jgi:heme exporter protein D
MDQWLADYWWVLLLMIPVGAVILFIFSIPAIQAKRRGYSFLVWLAAGLLVANPIYLLVVLGVLPHRTRQKMREQFRAELDAKLTATTPATTAADAIPDRTVGDQPTVLPGFAAATDGPLKSVGDGATILPRERSLGDEMTRG